jgi:hypothetical protein
MKGYYSIYLTSGPFLRINHGSQERGSGDLTKIKYRAATVRVAALLA